MATQPKANPAWRRLPLVTAALLAASLAAAAWPGLTEAWQYDRLQIEHGEWWRLVTGHLTHFNADHLFWDGLVFASLGGWLERRGRRRYVEILLASAATISAGLWILQPEMTTYRGLSGVDTALFVAVAIGYLADKASESAWLEVGLASTLMLGLGAKTLFETLTGATVFVDAAAAGFAPAPLAHLLGAVVGAASFVWPRIGPAESAQGIRASVGE